MARFALKWGLILKINVKSWLHISKSGKKQKKVGEAEEICRENDKALSKIGKA